MKRAWKSKARSCSKNIAHLDQSTFESGLKQISLNYLLLSSMLNATFLSGETATFLFPFADANVKKQKKKKKKKKTKGKEKGKSNPVVLGKWGAGEH